MASPILDAWGRPIQTATLNKTLAEPRLSGVRSIWNHSPVITGLTPAKLVALLRDAAEGNADAYLTLAEEMEERDLHYASVLGTRKRAVVRLPLTVEAASDSTEDVKLADAVRDLFKRSGTKALLEELMDALGKGYSVCEIIWGKGTQWTPEQYIWRDPHFFQVDRDTLSQIRMKDEADMMNGVELAPYKFIVHRPRLKSGLPLRGGIARIVAWSYLFKNYTVKDWMAFAEIFGMPLRLGKYRPGESEDNIAILQSAVANLGSDAAAVIPESMLIEFVESAKGQGGHELYLKLAEWLDKQVSKGVLGQTMTADDGSSQSQATVHNEVREDLRDADAEQLAETLMRDLVIPFIQLNFGPQVNYPRVCFHEPEGTDITIMSEALAKLVPLGLKVGMSEVRDKLGFADPGKDEECLGSPGAGLLAPAPGEKPKAAPGAMDKGVNREKGTETVDAGQADIDALMAVLTPERLQGEMEEVLNPVLQRLEGVVDYEEAMTVLAGIFPAMNTEAIESTLYRLMFIGDIRGRMNA